MDTICFRDQLVSLLSTWPGVLGIGQTGDIHAPLIPGRSDIDMFVICSEVPVKEERLAFYGALQGLYDELTMQVCAGGIWGYGDIFMVNGIDVMPMFFPVQEMKAYLEEVLQGKHLSKQGLFYPIGRLASIETLHVLYEQEHAWTDLITLVCSHPSTLFASWYASETSCIVDEEDLGRAALRHEVLFYHQVVQEFLDHFLQALYAKNNQYFPSRKRTRQAIEAFVVKPQNCYARLENIVQLASREASIDQSIAELRSLADELRSLPNQFTES